ncbi:stigma-specific protein Stig1 [Artemisia annua]|uniref:Stigma-specific protein Stig1 n=1 Tax=Artemisia annua TaxID=35608 RepID=A0A2U1L9X6_ARTAN|nr:stigma-specific protein Stig1 [Artemisia annua]
MSNEMYNTIAWVTGIYEGIAIGGYVFPGSTLSDHVLRFNKHATGYICCKGKCVNVMKDKRHCGGCGNRCKKGNTCVYGMCSYA